MSKKATNLVLLLFIYKLTIYIGKNLKKFTKYGIIKAHYEQAKSLEVKSYDESIEQANE